MPETIPNHPVFVAIDDLYSDAPEGFSESEIVRWAQSHATLPCPQCAEPLWILRTSRAQNRGFYHLAMCQNEECDFQIDD